MDRREVAEALLAMVDEAATLVMGVYRSPSFDTSHKGPDDPVTRADREANAHLVERISRAWPGVPIVAEESDPSTFAGYESSRAAFFVDPVDGTREFIAKNGEFAVMVGYAEDGVAVASVVVCPALGERYVGVVGSGAFRIDDDGARRAIHVSEAAHLEGVRCAVSRSRRNADAEAQLAARGCTVTPMGSAGVKGARTANGEVALYAFLSTVPIKLWDACAPDALVHAAGGMFTDATGARFDYRAAPTQGQGVLAASPRLHAEALAAFRLS